MSFCSRFFTTSAVKTICTKRTFEPQLLNDMKPLKLEPSKQTYTERYEKAEKLLDDLLTRAAKQYHDGGERKSAKIGVMKAVILQWAARETDCMDSLEYQATH